LREAWISLFGSVEAFFDVVGGDTPLVLVRVVIIDLYVPLDVTSARVNGMTLPESVRSSLEERLLGSKR